MDKQQSSINPQSILVEAKNLLEQAKDAYEQEEIEQALLYCEHVLDLDSASAEAYNLRGIIQEDLGNNKEALQSYRQAVQYDPLFEDAHLNLLELRADQQVLRHEQRNLEWKLILCGAFIFGLSLAVAGPFPNIYLKLFGTEQNYYYRPAGIFYAFSLAIGIGVGSLGFAYTHRIKHIWYFTLAGIIGVYCTYAFTSLFMGQISSLFDGVNFLIVQNAIIGTIVGLMLGLIARVKIQSIWFAVAGCISLGLYGLLINLSADYTFYLERLLGLEITVVMILLQFMHWGLSGLTLGALLGFILVQYNNELT